MKLFFVRCTFEPSQVNNLKKLRPDHQKYIHSLKGISYGGLELADSNKPIALLLFIDCTSKEEVVNIIRKDPYFSTYLEITVNEFSQKIPTKTI